MNDRPDIGSRERAAIKAHLALTQVAEIVDATSCGAASLDMTGANPVLTTVKVCGRDVAVRRVAVPRDALPRTGRVGDGKAVAAAAALADAIADDGLSNIPFSEAIDWFGLRGAPSGMASQFARSFAVNYPDLAVAPDVLREVCDIANARATQALRGRLDGEALAALQCAAVFDKGAYAFYAVDEPRRAFRHQAAKAYPLFAATMASKITTKSAIDRKAPLNEALEKAFGKDGTDKPFIGKPLLRRLAALAWPDNGVPADVLVKAVSSLPPDWFPKTRADWDAFTDLADTVFRHLPDLIGEKPESLAAGCAGRWVEFRRRLARAYDEARPPDGATEEEIRTWNPVVDESREAMARACHGVLEMVGLFRDVTVLPVAASRSDKDAYLSEETRRFATEAAGRILCSGKSLVAILETQRQWRTQIGPIMAALEIEEEEKKEPSGFVKQVAADGWAPLCNVVVAPNGVTVMPLTDPRELKYEGFGYHNGPKTAAPDPDGNMGLNHCVGGYSETCRRGNHIVSFRLYDGADPAKFTRLSTCEFHPIKADTNQLQKKQHYGVNDSTPNQTSRDAYDWFVHEVEVGNIPINREGVMSYMSGRKRAEDDVQEQAGYDRKNLDLVAAGLRAWQPYLTKKFRGLSVEALRQTPEVDPVAEAISPSYMPTY